MITYENEYGKEEELTVTEFKEKLEELEQLGYGDYIVCVGYDGNCLYSSTNGEIAEIKDGTINGVKSGAIYFNTDTTF